MARTPLFAALRRALHAAVQAGAPARPLGRSPHLDASDASEVDAAEGVDVQRRALLAGGVALGALGALPWTGCAGPEDKNSPADVNPDDTGAPDDSGAPQPPPRVAIIGAGMAGLHCALRLQEAGVEVRVYEANDRVGGRMFTGRDRFLDGQVCELGGELIDSNHATLWALAAELGVEMDDRAAFLPAGAEAETWWVGGEAVPTATITAEFVELAPTILAQVAQGEEDEDFFNEIDQLSLADWLDTYAPAARWPALHAVLRSAYRGEFGLEPEEQSAWNLLYLIGADDPDPFRIFGESDERYHAHAGNDRFPLALAERLDERVVRLNQALVAATQTRTGFALRLRDPDGAETTEESEHIVFALPFSVLRTLDLSGLALSDEKRAIIQDIGYGTNAKVMIGFGSRPWATLHGATGSLSADLPVQQTWDTSVGQSGDSGILTNFLGGEQGLACAAPSPEAWAAEVALPDLEPIWPGITAAHTGVAVRMHWPTAPWAKGSYTCYRPGQWATWGREGLREGDVHFCGEHTSLDFQGWMEGAAETGGLVALELIEQLGLRPTAAHRAALASKLGRPHSTYNAARWPPGPASRTWRARRRTLAG